ncbi:MAG: sulfotransferase, partial [Hyphomicrobiales bacterium]
KKEKKNSIFRNNLANSYIRGDVPELAIPHLRRAVELSPRLVEPHLNLGRAFRSIGKSKQAIECFQKALNRDASLEQAKLGLGGALIEMGRMEEACELLRNYIDTAEDPVPAATMLSGAFKFTTEHKSDIQRIEAILHQSDLDERSIVGLHYALGKIRNDLKEYEAAFEHFVAAKQIDNDSFDLIAHRKRVDRMIEFYSKFFFLERKDFGDQSERPVFIVGMPRSGTTLTEQIISSHPQVHGAGELDDIERVVGRIATGGKTTDQFYENLARMKPQDMQEAAGFYLRVLNRHSRTALRVVDKMPHNFEALGLISLLFPNAKVIYCRRDAMDNTVSCFMNRFNSFHSYNADLSALGGYYREHVRLMDHWKSVLPITILESRYEDLVADQEAGSRRLIEHLGLDWDDACLSFNEQDRSVQTLSRWQVRQPIYQTSMKRWKRYGKNLDPLKEALGDLFEEE